MTVETALRMLRLLPPGLDFVLEAPCASWRECLSLRRRTDIPIIWDELATSDSSVAQLVADDAAEGVDLKISKNGGLTKCRRQRDICISAGLTISVQDTTGSDIAFAAIVHMGQTIPKKLLRCVLESRDMVLVKTADGDFPSDRRSSHRASHSGAWHYSASRRLRRTGRDLHLTRIWDAAPAAVCAGTSRTARAGPRRLGTAPRRPPRPGRRAPPPGSSRSSRWW
jgi:Enolase C-terminal domain-like